MNQTADGPDNVPLIELPLAPDPSDWRGHCFSYMVCMNSTTNKQIHVASLLPCLVKMNEMKKWFTDANLNRTKPHGNDLSSSQELDSKQGQNTCNPVAVQRPSSIDPPQAALSEVPRILLNESNYNKLLILSSKRKRKRRKKVYTRSKWFQSQDPGHRAPRIFIFRLVSLTKSNQSSLGYFVPWVRNMKTKKPVT